MSAADRHQIELLGELETPNGNTLRLYRDWPADAWYSSMRFPGDRHSSELPIPDPCDAADLYREAARSGHVYGVFR